METLRDYDPHADLRAKLHAVDKRLRELEERVWQLKDEFYAHEKPAEDENDAWLARQREAMD